MVSDNFKDWAESYFDENVLSMFDYKDQAYGGSKGWDYNINAMAARQFPDTYENNPYLAMAKVCIILKDKHDVALARNPLCNEALERATDCVVYSLFIARLIQDAVNYDKGVREMSYAVTESEPTKIFGLKIGGTKESKEVS